MYTKKEEQTLPFKMTLSSIIDRIFFLFISSVYYFSRNSINSFVNISAN